jgi:DNA-binding MarR family transcriptional regulator
MRTDHLIFLASALRYHAVDLLSAELRACGINDLVPSHGALLSMLYGCKGRAAMKDVVKASGRGKSTMTEMAKALERNGYLLRERDPRDARGVILVLTPRAWIIRRIFDSISEKLLSSAWGDMPQEKRELLIQLLASVVGNIKESKKPAPGPGGRQAGAQPPSCS